MTKLQDKPSQPRAALPHNPLRSASQRAAAAIALQGGSKAGPFDFAQGRLFARPQARQQGTKGSKGSLGGGRHRATWWQ
ncbi:MAG TPA: hypothetical protein VJA94_21515 [Candidatus Angelobacter sp.]